MILLNFGLFALLILICTPLIITFFNDKKYIYLIAVGAFLTRAFLAFLLDLFGKEFFLLDHLGYEFRGQQLADSVGHNDTVFYNYFSTEAVNIYETILSYFFYWFGDMTYLPSVFNAMLSAVTIVIMARVAYEIFGEMTSSWHEQKNIKYYALMMCFYPSFVIWSSVNIKDPLFLMFCAVYLLAVVKLIKSIQQSEVVAAIFYLLLAGLSLMAISVIRDYFGEVLLVATALGLTFSILASAFKLKSSMGVFVMPVLILVVTVLLVGAAMPAEFAKWMSELENIRLTFTNIKYGDFATSSFLVEYKFDNAADLLEFLPQSVIYLLFAPFPWKIGTSLQAASLPEVLLVYMMFVPTLIGIHRAYSKSRFLTVLLVALVCSVTMGQSLAVSNTGTLFRHRMFAFIVLMMFSAEGVRHLFEKYKERKKLRLAAE